jgi:hypothetical protein
VRYIVASPGYWKNIPRDRELTCGRVRFVPYECPPPSDAGIHETKGLAVRDALMTHRQVIRELKLPDSDYQYQLLIGIEPA